MARDFDGQFQAQEFKETLYKELNVPIDPIFSTIVWHLSHWMNLAILDIRDEKLISEANCLKDKKHSHHVTAWKDVKQCNCPFSAERS